MGIRRWRVKKPVTMHKAYYTALRCRCQRSTVPLPLRQRPRHVQDTLDHISHPILSPPGANCQGKDPDSYAAILIQVMSSTVPSINPQTSPHPLLRTPFSLTLPSPRVSSAQRCCTSLSMLRPYKTANVHDAVFGLVQGRLAGLLDKSSGYIESILGGAKMTIEALRRTSKAG